MDLTLREAWAKIVTADDYEGHMAEVGQAQANAELVHDLIRGLNLQAEARVLFAGAGPGQMFDYVDAELFKTLDITFTDINPEFVGRLEQKARNAGLESFSAVLDDIEAPRVSGPFALAVLVLVLEHVAWRKALVALARLSVARVLIIVQKNPEGLQSAVSPNGILRPSLLAASQGQQAELVDPGELLKQMTDLGYEREIYTQRPVPDGKYMCAYIFAR
jgi:hypothetical protein